MSKNYFLKKRCIYIFSLFLLFSTSYLKAQIIFSSNFENGRLDTSYIDSSKYVIAPITNLHFKVIGVKNQKPEFKIFDSVGYHLRSYHSMVYRYENDSNWQFFDTSYKAGTTAFYHFNNTSVFTQDTVYIAYWFPYTYSQLETYINKIKNESYIKNIGIKGKSYLGKNIYGYEICDTTYANCYKKNVVITARQHPIENINGYFIEGFTDYLIYANDSISEYIKKNYRFFIYPMLNPDGVFNGWSENALGQGLNREWADSLSIGGTPEIDTIRPVIWNETQAKVDWSIDIHSNPGSNIKYYWWGYNSSSPSVSAYQINQATKYANEVSIFDNFNNSTLFQNYIQGNGVNSSLTAANWFRKSFNAISFTFEPTTEPNGFSGNNKISIIRMKKAGESLAKGFYNVFDSTEAMTGVLKISGNNVYIEVSGGKKPYFYSWSGPITSNNDTLFNPPNGTYLLTVTDSNGCEWKYSYIHTLKTYIIKNKKNNEFKVFPNTNKIDMLYIDGSQNPICIDIYNSIGTKIYSNNINRSLDKIDISFLRKGIYLITLKTDEDIKSFTLIKE